MNNMERVGANIRILRTAYGETEEELGAAIFAGKSTISNFETGRRIPTRENLEIIARHFGISVEELMYSNFPSLLKINIDSTAFWKQIDDVLPMISSEKAMQNEHFKRAYALHREFFNGLKQNRFDGEIDVCLEEYMSAGENEEIKAEAAANSIALLYLLLLMLNTPTIIDSQSAALNQIAKKDKSLKAVIDYPDSDMVGDSKKLLNELRDSEFEEMLTNLKITLKKAPQWSELADYYLALQYVWNIVGNELSAEFNRRIGAEMLDVLISVENHYAAKYILFTSGALGLESSQTVDDK